MLAKLERSAKHSETADSLAQQALAIVRDWPDCDLAIRIKAVDAASIGAWDAQRVDESRQLFQELVQMCRQLPGDHQPDIANSAANLAMLMHSPPELAMALDMLRESIATLQGRYGLRHSGVSSQYHKIALILVMQRDYVGAEQNQEMAVESARLLFGEGHPQVIERYSQLAVIHQFAGQHEKQAAALDHAIASATAASGEQSIQVADLLVDRASCFRWRGDMAASERDLRAALAILRGLGREHTELGANVFVTLVEADLKQGDLEEAEEFCNEIINMPETDLPAGHWSRAQTRSLLGEVMTARGDFQKAEALLLDGQTRLEQSAQLSMFKTAAMQRLVKLYKTWDAAEPSAGKAALATEWEQKLRATQLK